MSARIDLDSLRGSRLLASLSLMVLGLALMAAIASPWVNPRSVQMVCTYAGMSFIVVDDKGEIARPTAPALDCPMCLPAALPPALLTVPSVAPQPLAQTAIAIARHAAQIRIQPPARGPPRPA